MLPIDKNEADIYRLPISSHCRDIQMKIKKEILDVLISRLGFVASGMFVSSNTVVISAEAQFSMIMYSVPTGFAFVELETIDPTSLTPSLVISPGV